MVYTGTSSIDIRLALHQRPSGHTNSNAAAQASSPPHATTNNGHPGTTGEDANLVALFTFVARHPATRKATPVNPLQPQTGQQKAWYEERRALAAARKSARKGAAAGGAGAPAEGSGVKAEDVWLQGLLREAESMHMMPGVAVPSLPWYACLTSQPR